MATSLRCRIGWHAWRRKYNDSGERVLTCRRCGKLDNGTGLMPPYVG